MSAAATPTDLLSTLRDLSVSVDTLVLADKAINAKAKTLAGQPDPETKELLQVVLGLHRVTSMRKTLILIAEDLNFRAYWRGADRLFLNAVVLSPSAP